jgi:hypothetical protein
MKTCPCGSGLPRRELKDARGIFCTSVCDQCEAKKKKGLRPDNLHGSQLPDGRADRRELKVAAKTSTPGHLRRSRTWNGTYQRRHEYELAFLCGADSRTDTVGAYGELLKACECQAPRPLFLPPGMGNAMAPFVSVPSWI